MAEPLAQLGNAAARRTQLLGGSLRRRLGAPEQLVAADCRELLQRRAGVDDEVMPLALRSELCELALDFAQLVLERRPLRARARQLVGELPLLRHRQRVCQVQVFEDVGCCVHR